MRIPALSRKRIELPQHEISFSTRTKKAQARAQSGQHGSYTVKSSTVGRLF